MTQNAPAESTQNIKVTIVEEVHTTYVVTPEWLTKHDLPSDRAELNDYMVNGTEYAPDGEDPVDKLALALFADEELTVDTLTVPERDLTIDAG